MTKSIQITYNSLINVSKTIFKLKMGNRLPFGHLMSTLKPFFGKKMVSRSTFISVKTQVSQKSVLFLFKCNKYVH